MMKVTLYNAISSDGFIADKDGDSSWVSPLDESNFNAAIENSGNVVMGRKTFEQFENELFPIDGVMNFVFTHNKDFKTSHKNVEVITEDPKDFVARMEARGIENLLLIGGGNLNRSFMEANLIDEMILVAHPIKLGSGIKLFEKEVFEFNGMELIHERDLGEGVSHKIFKIKK